MRRSATLLAILLFIACSHRAGDFQSPLSIPKNEYGLEVISSKELYRETVHRDPRKELVELKSIVPGLQLEIHYATPDNFMKRTLYPVSRAFLRKPAAEALRDVQAELKAQGLGLKVFDGYRPYRVTVAMWNQIHNEDYVANPAKGSRHNRGCAVDLTLIELATGSQLEMPTGYDSFEPTAAHGFEPVNDIARRNRELLKDVMTRHGFEAFASEWWHYDFAGWREYELMDIPLESLP